MDGAFVIILAAARPTAPALEPVATGRWDLTALINAADPQASRAERHLWLVRWLEWPRSPHARRSTDGSCGTPDWTQQRLRLFLNMLDTQPAQRAKLVTLLRRFVTENDAAGLWVDMGFSPRTNFLNELGERLRLTLVPRTSDTDNLGELFLLLFPSAESAQWLAKLDDDTLARLSSLCAESLAEPARLRAHEACRAVFALHGPPPSLLCGADRRPRRPRRSPMNGQRRAWLKAATLLTGGTSLWGCREAPAYDGGWLGSSHHRGHLLRDQRGSLLSSTPAVKHRASVVVIGAGVAGLTCARQLLRTGIDDVHLLELEDTVGGNSRGHKIAGFACPLGAHYLPLPGPHATEVAELLSDWGLRSLQQGRAVYDERHLCHSPQERLWIDGHWHDGLLPPVEALPVAQRAATQAEYQRFAQQSERLGAHQAFTLPTARSTWTDALSALEAQTFAAWLDQEGYATPALRWYLDYCCHDDYGAGAAQVSAWAGVHYFASRHGFQAPGAQVGDGERDTVLTWPQGNAWLTERLAEPLGAPNAGRLHTGQLSWRVVPQRHGVAVDCWNTRTARHERWQAQQVVLAMPLFVAARLLTDHSAPAQALQALRPLMRQAPWLVANLHLGEPLLHQEGAAPSWDNLVYQPDLQASGPGHGRPLGWVDATHQRTRPEPGPTVFTAYWALGGQDLAQLQAQRQRLLQDPWSSWAERVLEHPAQVHPDLRSKVRRIDLMRYGHGMSIPTPGMRRHPALRALGATDGGRVHFAHADLSAYSVFEEAVYWGVHAAHSVVKALR